MDWLTLITSISSDVLHLVLFILTFILFRKTNSIEAKLTALIIEKAKTDTQQSTELEAIKKNDTNKK